METIIKINIEECAVHYRIDKSFILELSELDIFEIWEEDNQQFINEDALTLLEKSVHFREMGINTEGIDVIFNLLDKMQNLQRELALLKRIY